MKGSFGAQPVVVDPTHVWFPRNTEYEIFRSGGKQHTLGAFLILGHKERLDIPVFPLRRVSERAHAEGGLIDLEKHNWNWSMPIVPVLKPDLFELANNHHWRVEFGVRNWAVPAPAWMKLPGNGSGTDTEEAWTHYGFETYYALLNCGFRLKPTAGTGNGVHPVPLGFSRVYVHCEGGFSYEKWMKGLGEGRSFVTTGPMVMAVGGVPPRLGPGEGRSGPSVKEKPGEVLKSRGKVTLEFQGRASFGAPKQASVRYQVQLVRNGEVIESLNGPSLWTLSQFEDSAEFSLGFSARGIEMTESGWVAVRCLQIHPDGRVRFAHTAPWWVEIEGKPLRPRREQADWFVQRTEEEIARNTGVLSKEQLAEFHEALAAWKKIQATAQ
jgi:hypothetical protein